MVFDSSLAEAFCVFNFCDGQVDAALQPGSSSIPSLLVPSATISTRDSILDPIALIIARPELRLRNALPEPQNGGANCQQVSQSASQAIQQASQQASQAIQQAQQTASQSIQQASQQASQAIQQAQQTANQSVQQATQQASQAIQQAQQTASQSAADASRSVSSANSVVASVQASAASAISQASAQMQSAQISAAVVQSAASKAVLQAGAAVAAATGSAAAAGSSFLAAAAKATQGAQSSAQVLSAAASSQLAEASQQVNASQTQAVTATQAAIAIVGSIIASALITILIYFLLSRHKNRAKSRSRGQQSPGGFPSDPKFPATGNAQSSIPEVTLSFQQSTTKDDPSTLRNSAIKTSSVSWNPSNPPKAPTLGSWLKLQDGVSPFGPIKLPTNINTDSPLGGQLKSPHRALDHAQSPRSKLPAMANGQPSMRAGQMSSSTREPSSTLLNVQSTGYRVQSDRESKDSAYTDDIRDDEASLTSERALVDQESPAGDYEMQLPSLKKPVRTTAEWLAEAVAGRGSLNATKSHRVSFAFGLPKNPRTPGSGNPSTVGSQMQAQNGRKEMRYVQGLSRFLDKRGSTLSRGRDETGQLGTTGVGEAV